MKFRYCALLAIIFSYIFIPTSLKAGGGAERLNNIYVISIGVSNGVSKNISSDKIFVAANYECRTCLTDASGLPLYLKKLQAKLPKLIDSVFTYQYINADINIDTIYKAFLTVQKQARGTDVFVFYYAASNWGTIYNSELGAREGFYVINNKYDRPDNISKFSFTLRQLKALTDRIASQRQLIIFDTGQGQVIEAEYYKNFFNDNPIEANFTKKNRIVICPEYISSESLDEKENVLKGDLFKVISSMPDTLNIFTVFDTSMKSQLIKNSKYKNFMKVWYEQQLTCVAQIKILKELDYLNMLVAIKPINTGKRGAYITSTEEKTDSSLLTKKKKVLIVATNFYNSIIWAQLQNPINDAKAVGEVLRKKYGYEVLYLLGAPKDSILVALDNICNDTINPYSQYIVYFAGHGFYNPGQKESYIVCTDSKDVNTQKPSSVALQSYLGYTLILNKINSSLNKVVLITDVCFGGIAANSAIQIRSETEPGNQATKSKNPFKKMLASGITEVADFVRLHTGERSENSPFATALIEILKNNNDFLTFENLYAELQKRKLNPTPVEEKFGSTKIPNEFIF